MVRERRHRPRLGQDRDQHGEAHQEQAGHRVLGDRAGGRGRDDERPVQPPTSAPTRGHAEQEAHHGRDRDGAAHEEEGPRQAAGDQLRDRRALGDRPAEVAVGEADEIRGVLADQRPVEAIVRGELGPDLGVIDKRSAVRVVERLERVTRHQPGQQEHERDNRPHGDPVERHRPQVPGPRAAGEPRRTPRHGAGPWARGGRAGLACGRAGPWTRSAAQLGHWCDLWPEAGGLAATLSPPGSRADEVQGSRDGTGPVSAGPTYRRRQKLRAPAPAASASRT